MVQDMTSSLLQSKLLDDLAQHLSTTFCQDNPIPTLIRRFHFSGVAHRATGLGACWQGGSKRQALRKMLEVF